MLNIKNTTDGYLKSVEIKGNTIQDAENLADIRSVGDKVEGQELYKIDVVSRGKNLFDGNIVNKESNTTYSYDGTELSLLRNGGSTVGRVYFNKLKKGIYTFSFIKKIYPATSNLRLRAGVSITGSMHVVKEWYLPNTSNYANINFTLEEDSYIALETDYSGSPIVISNVQLEEGTVATPYEPYQEDKLTILSPVQLEKVGDVRDRIICKDGVFGVEKNVETVMFDGSEIWKHDSSQQNDTTTLFSTTKLHSIAKSETQVLCDKFHFSELTWDVKNVDESIFLNNSSYIYIRINKAKLIAQDTIGFKKWLKENPTKLMYQTTQPQFIPLPHDQQVKLRTFAGQTNIHFETEIEGTIKAQVPKSLGATVNTHTEQIGNLSKELDRVKKLEESTVSTVTTESDFTTVEETSNGYFENVKLEGRTLVNLWNGTNNGYGTESMYYCKPLTTYTIYLIASDGEGQINYQYKNISDTSHGDSMLYNSAISTDKIILTTIKTKEDSKNICIYSPSTKVNFANLLILEGDHTQNPPEYFEGLMSVGQDVDEVSVESVDGDGNLLMPLHTGVTTGSYNKNNITFSSDYSMSYIANAWGQGISVDVIGVVKGETYVVLCDTNKNGCIKGTNALNTTGDISMYSNKVEIVATSTGIGTITFKNATETGDISCTNLRVIKKGSKEEFSVLNQDKKPLLYYNNETQTWEKPILRQWDSIEKHADGKYYYHKRSGEVVLNGSENWGNGVSTTESNISFAINLVNAPILTNIINDKFNIQHIANGIAIEDKESIIFGSGLSSQLGRINITIAKSKLSTQDAQGFKAWLQANPTTVVYELAQEEVYECTNIDLITYENETNYVVNCGAIAPKSTLKVHNNISNVVKILQEKVSLLESNVKASQEVQDMMILETDMRMLDIELALMEHMPITLNLSENTMLRSATYFNFIKNHIVNETYSKDYLENVMNKYLATNRLTQEEYDELYKLLYPPVYDITLPIEE